MSTTAPIRIPSPLELARACEAGRSRCDWPAVVAHLSVLPDPLTREWLPAADAVTFALGQTKRFSDAIALCERAWSAEPSQRRASALAYLHYSALHERNRRGRHEAGDAEPLRKAFRRWIGEALREAPGSIKDLYRLGVFEAQFESRHDKVALRVFLRALAAYDALGPAERERRHDLQKYVARTLYAAARSALRLGQVPLARRLSFACVRDDEKRDHVAPVHKLGLAAKVCLAGGELDLAERAARKALDAKGPPLRDHLFGLLAEIAMKRGDLDAALGWIDRHVRPERRSAALWRQVGDIREARAELDLAAAAWRTSLARDRAGKHLTLVRIARLEKGRGRLREAERACHDALAFRRHKYLSEDPAALQLLGEILSARGRLDEAKAVEARLAKCRVPADADNDTEEVA